MIPRADITAIVLAGGRGRRMGGQDKGWVELGGKPLIEHVISRLGAQVGDIVISANRHLEPYRALGFRVVSDDTPDFAGPLSGALAGIQCVSTPWVLLAPVDMPALPHDCVERLARASANADIVMAHDGARRQPLVALLRSSLRADLATWLAGGDAKVMNWYERHRLREVIFPNREREFSNLNTPEERVDAETARNDRHGLP